MERSSPAMKPWGPIKTAPDQCLEWILPYLAFRVMTTRDEWLLSVERKSSGNKKPVFGRKRSAVPPAWDWMRFVTVADDHLRLLPALPDKPLVVRPESHVRLLPGRRADFYLRVPLWIRFVGEPKTGNVVFHEEPVVLLSNTWFGDLASGELCYSIDSPLFRAPSSEVDPFSAMCRVAVHNGSAEKLDFTSVCVHVENLNLFEGTGGFLTNDMTVSYRGTDLTSQIVSSDAPPSGGEGSRLVCEPRIVVNRNLIRKTFDAFRTATGM